MGYISLIIWLVSHLKIEGVALVVPLLAPGWQTTQTDQQAQS
jgi:hypothetical protein